jgi:LacI family transcriptional regulator
MHLTVTRLTDEELSREDFVPKVLREHMADGMIVNYTHAIPPAMLELIHAHHTPAVWLNAKLGEDCVYPDDRFAAESVTRELLKLGHRRIALVHTIASLGWQGTFGENWARVHYSVPDRASGFGAAMREAGRAPRIVSHERFIEPHERIDACVALLSAKDRPTAVLAYSENEVESLMCAARMLGLVVPRDLSVVVFAPSSNWIAGYQMSVAAVPTEEMGRRAVRMLLERLKFPDANCAPEAIPYGLVAAQSVGPAPAD